MATMPIVPLFLFKLSVSLAVVWGFYQLVLRRLTFYGLNRWYLLGYTLLSFLIPFINIGPMLPDGPEGEPVMLRLIPAIGGVSQQAAGLVTHAGTLSHAGAVTGWTVLLWLLAVGSVVLLARVIVRWVSLLRLRRNARLIGGEGVKIYQVDGRVTPFSFGNAIFINHELHSEKELADIIVHEYVHIRQRHTIDILIAELVCVVNWYNPFAWLIRYSIRQNLEFIADQQVLDKGVDRKGYQYHLLKVVGEPQYRLANNFNFSSLKKRIIMMNRVRSARVHLIKLLFLLPLVGVLLVAFRDKGAQLFGPNGPVYVNAAGIVIAGPERKPLEGVAVREKGSGLKTTTDVNGFYKLQVPITGTSANINIEFTKPGYDTDSRQRNFPIGETTGILDIGTLHQLGGPGSGLIIAPVFIKVPSDPAYSDAKEELRLVLKENDDVNRFLKLQKDHPEIGLFYETEDRRKEIVIYMDGTIGRYGYPGTPGLQELYYKYGKLAYFASDDPKIKSPVSPGYLAHWAAIGEEAQKEFHTTNPNVRTVIFPGDSRVIVVPVTGKPRYYDMDNNAESERGGFEQLYGKLPACVPKAGFNSDEDERKAGWPPRLAADSAKRAAAAKQDTVPAGQDNAAQDNPARHLRIVGRIGTWPDSAAPLYIVDGKRMPAGWDVGAIPEEMVISINVIQREPAIAAYGEEGRHGVLLITTKDTGHDWAKSSANKVRVGPVNIFGDAEGPLFIIGGKAVPHDTLSKINPDSIASIDVFKDQAYLNSPRFVKYGERAKNGIVVIHLKSEKIPLCLVDGQRVGWDSVKRMDPARIESMNVLDAKDGEAAFGEKGKNGVVLVHLKP